MEKSVETIEIKRIAQYVKISREAFETGLINDDWALDILTAKLHGLVYKMAKQEGEITAYADRPKFLDWLLRRKKPVVVKYQISELVKKDKMVFPDNIRIIQITLPPW